MTQDLKQSIAKMEKKHAAMGEEHAALGEEIAAMKEKLKQGERFEFQGGCYIAAMAEPCGFYSDGETYSDPLFLRTNETESASRLAAWLTNQAILWQVAEFVNGGWVRPKKPVIGACDVYFNFLVDSFKSCFSSDSAQAIFKNKEAAERACKILNEQAEELGWVK